MQSNQYNQRNQWNQINNIIFNSWASLTASLFLKCENNLAYSSVCFMTLNNWNKKQKTKTKKQKTKPKKQKNKKNKNKKMKINELILKICMCWIPLLLFNSEAVLLSSGGSFFKRFSNWMATSAFHKHWATWKSFIFIFIYIFIYFSFKFFFFFFF